MKFDVLSPFVTSEQRLPSKLSYCNFPCKSKFIAIESVYCFKSFTYITEICRDLPSEIFKCIFFSYKGVLRDTLDHVLLLRSNTTMRWKKCLSYPKFFAIPCIVLYGFIGRCSIDMNCIASWTSIFLNRLKTTRFILCLAISFRCDFITKANKVFISSCSPFGIYPKMACKTFALSHLAFF